MKIIDINNWERKEHFLLYTKDCPCTYSATVDFDITSLKEKIKKADKKFYITFIYLLSKSVNTIEQFRCTYNEKGQLCIMDYLNPSYTIFHDDTKTFSNLFTEYDENFITFYENYKKDIKEYGGSHKLNPKGNIENYFNISALPSVDFTAFNLNLKNDSNYLLPIFTLGKFKVIDNKTILPLAIQVHHGVIDGYHLGRFVEILKQNIEYFDF